MHALPPGLLQSHIQCGQAHITLGCLCLDCNLLCSDACCTLHTGAFVCFGLSLTQGITSPNLNASPPHRRSTDCLYRSCAKMQNAWQSCAEHSGSGQAAFGHRQADQDPSGLQKNT